MGVIIEGVQNWSHVNQGILSREEGSIKELLEKVRMHQEKMNQVKRVVKNTLDGSIPKIKSELKKEIDRFFDLKSEYVLGRIFDFIIKGIINLAIKDPFSRNALSMAEYSA